MCLEELSCTASVVQEVGWDPASHRIALGTQKCSLQEPSTLCLLNHPAVFHSKSTNYVFYLIANFQGNTVADRIVRIKKGFDCRYQLGVNLKDSTHTVMEAMPHL